MNLSRNSTLNKTQRQLRKDVNLARDKVKEEEYCCWRTPGRKKRDDDLEQLKTAQRKNKRAMENCMRNEVTGKENRVDVIEIWIRTNDKIWSV